MKLLRAIDICAGAGGWAVAARGLPIQIIAAFDWQFDCLLTYRENHPYVQCIQCDVTQFDFSVLRQINIDLILGAIPCEEVSIARNGQPLAKGKIESLRALCDKCTSLHETLDARHWVFEDVAQIVPHCEIMTPYYKLDSQAFSAQRRVRVYLGNVPVPRVDEPSAAVLNDHIRPGPYRRSMRLKDKIPARSFNYNSNRFYPWMPDEKSPTVIGLQSRHDNYAAVAHNDNWRQVEWQELATLQGFPNDYVFIGSPTRVSKMVAQAVQVDTARAILQALCAQVSGG